MARTLQPPDSGVETITNCRPEPLPVAIYGVVILIRAAILADDELFASRRLLKQIRG